MQHFEFRKPEYSFKTNPKFVCSDTFQKSNLSVLWQMEILIHIQENFSLKLYIYYN